MLVVSVTKLIQNVDKELENAFPLRESNTDEVHYSDGLIQDGVNSIASALGYLQTCTKPLIYSSKYRLTHWGLVNYICVNQVIILGNNLSPVRHQAILWTNPGSLPWRHNERDGVSNHQRLDRLLNRLFRPRLKKTSKLRVTRLWPVNSSHKGPIERKMFPFDDVIMLLTAGDTRNKLQWDLSQNMILFKVFVFSSRANRGIPTPRPGLIVLTETQTVWCLHLNFIEQWLIPALVSTLKPHEWWWVRVISRCAPIKRCFNSVLPLFDQDADTTCFFIIFAFKRKIRTAKVLFTTKNTCKIPMQHQRHWVYMHITVAFGKLFIF